ncbi:PDZ domain-containing protein [Microlunatus elymi]|uniref:PDZ domain-containing protein n=1 Tax=Microlunatus elymi TaxID=2596828 RepID=A0A516PV77_9ACTN|nr:trypsin-like peptidase domain-containing protein [Microlunatus elymi]QDP95097.1 PDZ domain-containing protein [Microlunatus elymi]
MNENVPGTGNDPQWPSSAPHGADSSSEDLSSEDRVPRSYGGQSSAQQPYPQTGFGQQQPHHPGYQNGPSDPGPYGPGTYGTGSYQPTDPYRSSFTEQSTYSGQPSYAGQQDSGMPAGGSSSAQGSGAAGGSLPPTSYLPVATPAAKPRRRGALLIVSLAVAALVGAGAGIGSYAYLDHGQAGSSVNSPITINTQTAQQQAKTDGTVEGAAKVIEPSVVTITVQSGSSGDIGSGVVLDNSGHILTNAHVVADSSQSQDGFPGSQQQSPTKITVTFMNGKTASASVVGTDETDDLAVIKVHGVKNLTPADFAKSSSLTVGQSVVAVGAPLGLSQTVTSGIVSNTARPVRSGNNNDAVYMAVQTDAAINPGNSGGPLVNLNGSVVGINSSIASTADSQSGSQSGNIGIGFAIPADVAVRVASQLIDSGHSADAILGVTIDAGEGGTLGSTTAGVQLHSVNSGGPAAKAGLKAGDTVTAVNDFKVTTADGLIAATHYYAPGTTVTVDYQRDGQSKSTQVTLGTA